MLRVKGFSGSLAQSELSVLFRRRRTWAMLFTISLIPIFLAIAVKLSGSTLAPGEGPPFLDRVSQNGMFVGFTAMLLAIPLFLPLTIGVQPVSQTLFAFPIALIAPIFLLLSAAAHLFVSSPIYVRKYEQNIEAGINPARWWEYAISSSAMLVVLLMLGGLIELSSIVFVFTLNFIMNLMGLMMEKYNQLTEKTSWLPFNIGVLAGIVPWIMGGLYFWVSTNNIADSIPVYAQFGFLLTFLFFNTFAINMWLQYKKVGKWKVYAYGERAYIVLSLVSKSALGWIIVLGTMGV